MGWLRNLLGVIGIVLTVLPFLPFDVLPENSLIGIVSNDILSIVAGILILLLVFLSWNRTRKRRKETLEFGKHLEEKRIRSGLSPAEATGLWSGKDMKKRIMEKRALAEDRKARELRKIQKKEAMKMRAGNPENLQRGAA